MKIRTPYQRYSAVRSAIVCAALIVVLSTATNAQQNVTAPTRADSIRRAKEFFINGTTMQLQGGREAEAILEFQQSLRYDSSATCLAAIARCYAQLRKLDLAYEFVRLSLNKNTTSRDAWELLAEIEVQRGHYDEGLKAYEEIIKLKPTTRQLVTLARLYEPRNARRAIELYQRVIETKPDIQILGRLADLYERVDDISGMIRTLEHAVELEPSNPQLSAALSEQYVSQGMFTELAVVLRRWNSPDPDMQSAGRVWAVALSSILDDTLVSGMYPEKIADLLDATFTTHSSSWPLMAIGAALAGRISDSVRSVRMMNMALASPLAVAETYLEVTRLSLLQKMPNRAMGYVERGRTMFPLDVRMLLVKASIYLDQGEDMKAIAAYNDAVHQAPLTIDAWAQLGWLYDRHKQIDSSDACYERALMIDPRHPFVCNNYAYSLCLRNKDLRRALQLSETSLEAEPNNAAYLDTYAWILFRLENYDDAEKAARQAIA
ncbi:MAG: hypothetical protein FGM32_11440, partial [Candidatus Kapabacteria bacterium]|nr:hypothetical protein [Candidatus Kapabacteria bacterium]